MTLGRAGSFAVGVASTLLCVAAWAVKSDKPVTMERRVAAPGAWIWTPSTASWALVPYASPLHDPRLLRAEDGSILAAERAVFEGTPQRARRSQDGTDHWVKAFDRDSGVQRFDGGAGFAPLTVALAEEIPPGAPFPCWSRRVSGGTWLAGNSNAKTPTIPTTLFRSGAWVPGPAIPEGRMLAAVVALEGGRLVAYCGDRPYGDGPPTAICAARESDASFRVIPAPLLPWYGISGAMVAAGSDEVLIVSRGDGSHARMQLVNVDTGAARDGPPGPRPFPPAPLTWGVSSAPLDDGRLLLAPLVDHMERRSDPAGTTALALALALTASSVGALVAFRRRLSVRWVIWGIVVAPVLAAVVGFGLAVFVTMHLHW